MFRLTILWPGFFHISLQNFDTSGPESVLFSLAYVYPQETYNFQSQLLELSLSCLGLDKLRTHLGSNLHKLSTVTQTHGTRHLCYKVSYFCGFVLGPEVLIVVVPLSLVVHGGVHVLC